MNTSDFEKAGSGKTRFGAPIKRGEKVMVPIVREDFQERFMELYDGAAESKQLLDEMKEMKAQKEHDPVVLHELERKQERQYMVMEIKTKQLWLDLQDHYNIWGKNIGLRDGFVLVECLASDNPFRKMKGLGMGIGLPGGPVRAIPTEDDIPDDAPEHVKRVLRKILAMMRELDSELED